MSAGGGPLAGRVIAVTRAADQAGPLVERIEALGARVVQIPIIRIAEPSDGGVELRRAIDDLRAYHWVVFTSPNAARRFIDALAASSPEVPDGPKFAVVGPGTAAVLRSTGWRVDLVPSRNIGEGLADAFPSGSGRVLLPRAAVAREIVPEELRRKGWTVDVVEVYRTLPARPEEVDLTGLAEADTVVFTSSSTVNAFVDAVGAAEVPRVRVSMGEATTDTAVSRGLSVTVTASPSTLDGLVEALLLTAD